MYPTALLSLTDLNPNAGRTTDWSKARLFLDEFEVSVRPVTDVVAPILAVTAPWAFTNIHNYEELYNGPFKARSMDPQNIASAIVEVDDVKLIEDEYFKHPLFGKYAYTVQSCQITPSQPLILPCSAHSIDPFVLIMICTQHNIL